MKFDIKEYTGRQVMHCDEEWKADIFMEYLASIGRKWCNGRSYFGNSEFSTYRHDTCYDFNCGQYCNISYFEEHEDFYGGYTILEFDDFEWDGAAEIQEIDVSVLDGFLFCV